ncbi:adenosine deaminase [Rugosimonospora africana]|uniref:Aminodeoxyfutalosine deaminase n=1 Tax=Rugosimonospora africana TaxID=556532 RepID=A0A8J3QME0_9ACTN|nr:adenosine deaminase [Rugosimonospora africana]GIH13261.1 aminodeoxyfutalosine deaminase [Rugosimonospora africana]
MSESPAVPKIELHVHLEGTIRPATLLEIARRNGESLPADSVAGLEKLYEFTNFAHFIDVWILTTNCLRTADDFRRVVVDYAAEAASFGAVYLEGIFSPAERFERGIGWDEIFTGYCEGAVEAYERSGVVVRFTPDLRRGLDPEIAEESARVAVRYADRGVVGFGLGGMEAGMPAEPYRRAFDIARDGGLAPVPHAGEAAGPDSIREILTFNPARIRHGIRAVEDQELLKEIVERGIVLDVCPTSNLRTGVVPSIEEHPLPALHEAGALCTINTDDPAMFGTDLGREYEIASRLGLDPAEAYAAGLAGALCDDTTRQRLAGPPVLGS